MKHVHQYQLTFAAEAQRFEMPANAVPLAFEVIDNNARLWALIEPSTDPEAEAVPRWFTVIGSDQPVPDNAVYLGTCPHIEKSWHLFETQEPPTVEPIAIAEPLPAIEPAEAAA